MCATRWQLVRAVRFGLRDFTNPVYVQTRHMARRGSPMIYKAVYDEEGNTLDTSRLGQMKETALKSEQLAKVSNLRGKRDDFYSEDEDFAKEIQRKPDFAEEKKSKKAKQSLKKLQEFTNKEFEEQDEEHELLEQTQQQRGFHIPRYTKINGWDKRNKHLKELGKALSHNRPDSDCFVLEGTRLINDALASGLKPSTFIFSRVKLLKDVPTQDIDGSCEFYHVPYNNIKMWSDLKTPTGLMAAFNKSQIAEIIDSKDRLPLTLICDNMRTPDNLGACLRVGAAVGATKVILTNGCVSPWNRKVLRGGAGAHFKIPIEQRVSWKKMKEILPEYPQLVLCDLASENEDKEMAQISDQERLERLDELESLEREEGSAPEEENEDEKHDNMENNPEEVDTTSTHVSAEILAKYRSIPIASQPYHDFSLNPGIKEVVVVVGGETEGVSNAAYRFCHKLNGSRLHIPLRNSMNSLNVVSASSVVMFTIQQHLLKKS
eukprot:TRINITY_DN1235_c0_g1_i6.p1 TRINITY_DN1235_c0_g1~~TRINITY_DN1235_c0_g1_i6.p1  ORF type:complete len:490 (+),score=103.81 TRINITY_DN1235_c0_g1_i6:50-1519(+)